MSNDIIPKDTPLPWSRRAGKISPAYLGFIQSTRGVSGYVTSRTRRVETKEGEIPIASATAAMISDTVAASMFLDVEKSDMLTFLNERAMSIIGRGEGDDD